MIDAKTIKYNCNSRNRLVPTSFIGYLDTIGFQPKQNRAEKLYSK